MIIESGIDVVQVLCGSVGDGTPVGLWIVAADEDLRLLSVEPVPLRGVGGDYPGVRASDSLIARLDAVEEMLLDSPRIAYFALAWSSDTDLECDSTWLRDLDSDMRERPELSAARLLGLVVFDPTTVFASLPRCDFSLDRDFHDLPRAVAVRAPRSRLSLPGLQRRPTVLRRLRGAGLRRARLRGARLRRLALRRAELRRVLESLVPRTRPGPQTLDHRRGAHDHAVALRRAQLFRHLDAREAPAGRGSFAAEQAGHLVAHLRAGTRLPRVGALGFIRTGQPAAHAAGPVSTSSMKALSWASATGFVGR